jgi:transcriptional regulator with XRE-family HTH domain
MANAEIDSPMRQAMKKAGFETNLALALKLGVGETTVWRWLNGTVPSWKKQRQIADALGVSERELWPDA